MQRLHEGMQQEQRFQALQQISPCLLSSPDLRPSALCEVSQMNARQPAAIGQTKQVNTKCRFVPIPQVVRVNVDSPADLHHDQ